MRKHGRNGGTKNPIWTRLSAEDSASRKRVHLSCEPGRQTYTWQLDASPKIIKH